MSRPLGPRPGWTVVVTGASSGLGRAIALELARVGCALLLAGRDGDRLNRSAAACRSQGSPWVQCLAQDLAVEGGADELALQIAALGRPVDALVNNAGAGWAGSWSSGNAEHDRALFRLLVDAPLTLTRALLPGWRARGRGAVLNVSSTGAFQPGPQTAVYYAAKSFLLSWSVALAREERTWLAVTTVCPGALATGFASAAGKQPLPGAPGPEKTARAAVMAWSKGRPLVVPGWFNKGAVLLSRLLPLPLVARGVEAVQLSVRKR